MAKEKEWHWHECFGKYKDPKNCDGCNELKECLEKSGNAEKQEALSEDNQ